MTRLALLFGLAFIAVACAEATSTPSSAPSTAGPASPAPEAQAGPASPAPEAQAGPAIIPVLASSETAIGDNRFLFSLVDSAGALLAAPDVDVHLRFFEEADPETLAFESDARFLWAIEGQRGLYATDVTFPRAGNWGTLFEATFPDGTTSSAPLVYSVRETTSTPALGSAAPAVTTLTAADVDGDLAQISTDTEPLDSLYEQSLDAAVVSGEPFVVAFVTPAFCQTATCGPTLDKVKEVAVANPGIEVLHLEPYVMAMKDDRLQPVLDENGQLQAAEWTLAWGLLTEPFVAVVDAEGNVSAKFEGAITTDELEDAIAEL
jgi:hypothetical protein